MTDSHVALAPCWCVRLCVTRSRPPGAGRARGSLASSTDFSDQLYLRLSNIFCKPSSDRLLHVLEGSVDTDQQINNLLDRYLVTGGSGTGCCVSVRVPFTSRVVSFVCSRIAVSEGRRSLPLPSTFYGSAAASSKLQLYRVTHIATLDIPFPCYSIISKHLQV